MILIHRFDAFYRQVVQVQSSLGVSDPSLHRKRCVPHRFEVGTSAGDLTPESHY